MVFSLISAPIFAVFFVLKQPNKIFLFFCKIFDKIYFLPHKILLFIPKSSVATPEFFFFYLEKVVKPILLEKDQNKVQRETIAFLAELAPFCLNITTSVNALMWLFWSWSRHCPVIEFFLLNIENSLFFDYRESLMIDIKKKNFFSIKVIETLR